MNQFQGGSYQQGYGQAVAHASVDERASFILKTYLHLVGAIFAFVAFEAVIQISGLGMKLLELTFLGGRFGWLLFLGLFMVVSWVADKWARSDTSPGMQYAGLALYTVAEAVIFAPLILMAISLDASTGGTGGGILLSAGVITIVLFGALTGVVFITRKDFSFLRSVLIFGGFAAMALIVASLIFGFHLGIIFCWAMVVFAAVSILYKTSNVLHYYRTDQHVAAALQLFASFALLLYYVIIILMDRR